ncbi:MAG: VWA domain-containing protein [Gammaproteobacteria bacterium]
MAAVAIAAEASLMPWLETIELRNPWWLLLALQPLVLWLLMRLRQRRRVDAFADKALLPWVESAGQNARSPWRLRQLALVLAWCSLALAMAGPRILQQTVAANTSQFLQLQVVVDESYSMSARDVSPSRLQRAVLELHDLIDRLHQVRMGIIVYAAHAHVMIPGTSDKSILRQSVAALRVRQLPTEGSGMFNALRLAQTRLLASDHVARAILLVSDGGILHDDAASRQRLTRLVSGLRQHNIHLYVLGLGTPQGAPLLNDQNGWLKYAGRPVVTRLAATRLQRLAQLGNGAYAKAADDDSDWRTLYDDGIARLALQEQAGTKNGVQIWHDLSAWFVLPGLILLLLAYVRVPVLPRAGVSALVCGMLLLVSLSYAPQGQAAEDNTATAWRLYRQGHYSQAAQAFARRAGFQARMAEAASWYQAKNYPRAATVYIQAVLDADSDQQRADALFNLANCYYRQARYARAARTYRDVLRYRPNFSPARINLSYAEALQTKPYQVPPVGGRAGTGYHTAPAKPDTDVGKGRVSIDESEHSGKTSGPVLDRNNIQGQANLLQQARPASSQVELNKDTQWTYDITRARDIRTQDTRISVDQSVFWQRLYEAEEGFPAPRRRPEVLPGVPPW